MSTESKSENTQITSEDTRESRKNINKLFEEIKNDKFKEMYSRTCNTGFLSEVVSNLRLTQSQTIPRSEERSSDLAFGTLFGIAPEDELEAMLAVQMSALHHAAMDSFCRANYQKDSSTHGLQTKQAYLNTACKLTRAFAQHIDALNRYRGKGQQKMTVEHVHVHSGGQAIVGAINTAREPQGGEDK